MTRKETNGCTVLEAAPGMRILKRDGFVCGTMVWLAGTDSADNYSEITAVEAEELEEAARAEENGETGTGTPDSN